MRTRQVNIRLNHEEAERVDALAAHHELTVAGLTRMLWKREHEALQATGALPTSPSTKRQRKGRTAR